MRQLLRASVALLATALTSAAYVTATVSPADAATRLEAESSSYGGSCGDGQAQNAYTTGDGATVVFNGGSGCTMTFTAPSNVTNVQSIRWFGGGSASQICGYFQVMQGGAEKARTASTCSVGGASPTDWKTPTFPAHTLASGSFQIVWQSNAGWQDAHVDWIEVGTSVTRLQAESSSYGGTCGDGQAQSSYTTGDGATVVFNGGSGCTMTFTASSTTSVQTLRWFGGGSASQICGYFQVMQGGAEKARTASTCSVGGASPTDWKTPTFPAHTLSSGSFQIVWQSDAGWQDAHVDWIEVGSGSTPPPCGNPTAGITPASQGGTAAYTATFTLSAAAGSNCSLSSYNVNFGNGSSQPGTGTPPSTLTHTYSTPGTYTVTFTVTQSDGKSASATATVTVTGPPPGNDNFTSATTVASTLPFRHVTSTAYATLQSGEPRPCASIGSTVWYKWTAPVTQAVEAELYGSDYNTALAVYTGSSLTALTQVGCSDGQDDTAGGPNAQVSWTANAGTTYYVQVGGKNGATGNADFDIKAFAGPANDHFENARSIVEGAISDNTFGSSSQTGEKLGCGSGTTVWYRYTHPSTSQAKRMYLSTFETSYNTAVGVWTGSTLASLTSVTCNNDARSRLQSQVMWLAQPGVTYYVQASGIGNTTGMLRMRFRTASIVALGDSVVAGHGVGSNPNGYPNNPTAAYSQLVGNDLSMNVYNMAISGACASNNSIGHASTPASCTKSIMANEINSIPVTPTQVILGVGGNDIEFAACIEGFMTWDGVSNDAAKELMDRCQGPVFDQRITALAANVRTVLDQVNNLNGAGLPGPYVTLVGYYNLFPDAPIGTDANNACDMWFPAAISRNKNLAAEDHNGSTFRNAVLPVQREAYTYAQNVVTRLNTTLQTAATEKGAQFVATASTFVNHDICRSIRNEVAGLPPTPTDTWVFGPYWNDSFKAWWLNNVEYTSRLMPSVCQFPGPGDTPKDTHVEGEYGFFGLDYTYDIHFEPNCMAHPTATGHQEIAKLVKPKIPLS